MYNRCDVFVLFLEQNNNSIHIKLISQNKNKMTDSFNQQTTGDVVWDASNKASYGAQSPLGKTVVSTPVHNLLDTLSTVTMTPSSSPPSALFDNSPLPAIEFTIPDSELKSDNTANGKKRKSDIMNMIETDWWPSPSPGNTYKIRNKFHYFLDFALCILSMAQ